jgi:hypothetical protein
MRVERREIAATVGDSQQMMPLRGSASDQKQEDGE